jgi:hypothetical protein
MINNGLRFDHHRRLRLSEQIAASMGLKPLPPLTPEGLEFLKQFLKKKL